MARDEPRTDRQLIEETLDRSRRTETRVTKIANHLGVEAGGNKPVFNDTTRTLDIPSRKTSLDDIIAAIGDRPGGSIAVYCDGQLLVMVTPL